MFISCAQHISSYVKLSKVKDYLSSMFISCSQYISCYVKLSRVKDYLSSMFISCAQFDNLSCVYSNWPCRVRIIPEFILCAQYNNTPVSLIKCDVAKHFVQILQDTKKRYGRQFLYFINRYHSYLATPRIRIISVLVIGYILLHVYVWLKLILVLSPEYTSGVQYDYTLVEGSRLLEVCPLLVVIVVIVVTNFFTFCPFCPGPQISTKPGRKHPWMKELFVCLYVVFVPLENFSLIWRPHHCRWSDANIDLCPALMAI